MEGEQGGAGGVLAAEEKGAGVIAGVAGGWPSVVSRGTAEKVAAHAAGLLRSAATRFQIR